MEESIIKNSLIGTFYDNNNYYISIYDMNKNVIRKELINELSFSKEKINNTNVINKEVKNDAFCFDCKQNINLNINSACKSHSIKYLNDLIKDINIEEIEEKLEIAIESYENVYRIIEEKLNKFKKRNENQIILAKKIIELYKSNINNLNYQILLNTKNILHFNEIKLKDYEDYNSKFILETNILKEYSLNNYINEKIDVQKIQKNTEIKSDIKFNIGKVILLKRQNKIIFNTSQNIVLLNNKNYIIQDKIQTKDNIKSMNLIGKEMILISFKNSIKKLKIENDKIIIEDFLNGVHVSKPGIIIKYKDEYAWTNRDYIEFSHSKAYDYEQYLNSEYDYKTSYYFKVINLIQFFDDIIFIIYLRSISEDFYTHNLILGSIKKGSCKENYIDFEEFDFDGSDDYDEMEYYKSINTDYNIYISNYYEIIINGKLGIYIINPYQWIITKKITFSNKLIENIFYLNDSFFLIFFRKYLFKIKYYEDEQTEKELININNENNNIVIAKIGGNCSQINFETLLNCEGQKIYYSPDINDNIYNLVNQFISVQNNIASVYELININKKIEMTNSN